MVQEGCTGLLVVCGLASGRWSVRESAPLHSTVGRMHVEPRVRECRAMRASLCHMTRRVQCHVYSQRKRSFGSKKCSVNFTTG